MNVMTPTEVSEPADSLTVVEIYLVMSLVVRLYAMSVAIRESVLSVVLLSDTFTIFRTQLLGKASSALQQVIAQRTGNHHTRRRRATKTRASDPLRGGQYLSTER